MIILISLVTTILFHGVIFVWLYFHKKKKGVEYTQGLWKDLFSFEISFLSALLFSVIAFICFPRISFSGGLWFSLAINLIVTFLRPARLIECSWRIAPFPKKKVIVASILLAGFLSETFIASSGAYRMEHETVSYSSLSSEGSISGIYSQNEDGSIRITNNSCIILSWNEEWMPENVGFTFKEGSGATITVKSYYSLDGVEFTQIGSHRMDDRNTNFSILPLYKVDAPYFKWSFEFITNFYSSPIYADLESISIEIPLEFNFSPIRFGLFSFLVLFFAHLKEISGKKEEKKVGRTPYLAIAGVMVAFLIGLGIFISVAPGEMARLYPIPIDELYAQQTSHTGETDIFVSLFDAFMKGRVDLDLPVDPGLLELSNPYDPSARAAYDYYWDHAFYNGKYYSYYGPMPVVLMSFPFYFLSGGRLVLTAFGLEVMGMPLFVGSFLLLLLEIMQLGKKQFSWGQYITFAVLGLFTIMSISVFTWKNGIYHEAVYHVPDIYGMAAFSMFLFFTFRAYRKEKLRSLNLALAGLFFVFVIFARPNLFVGLIAVAPLFLGILFQKGVKAKTKAIWFFPMAGVLAAGGALACVYNYVRFDSILEFGQSYQFTVADQTNLTYSTQKLLPTFFHFFLQGGKFYNQFPYLSCSNIRYDFETKALAPYVQSCYGILAVPFFWIAILLPFIYHSSQKKGLQWMGYLFPLTLFIFAFTTYSKAGVCPRYLSEIFYLSTIGSIFGLLRMEELTQDTNFGPICVGVGIGLFVLSAFICLNLSFDSFDGMKEGSFGGLLLTFREAFGRTYF